MNNTSIKLLTLNELIESHLIPLEMTAELQQQILQSFLFLCNEINMIDDSTGETFYPMPYQEITECIYELEFEFSAELNSVIEGLIEPLKKLLKLDGLPIEEAKTELNRKSVHKLNAYKRFVSHIQLAVCQKKFIADQTFDVILQVNELKQENKKLGTKLRGSLNTILDLRSQIKDLELNLDSAKKAANEALANSTQLLVKVDKASEEATNALGDAQKAVYQVEQAIEDAQQASSIAQQATESANLISEKVDNALRKADKASDEASSALKEAVKARKETEATSKNIITQFVTILGIFASIIVALFGGMSLIRAAVELLTNDGSLPIFVFVVAILLLSFIVLIVLLTSWITSLNTKKDCSYNLMKGVIILGLLVIIAVSGGFIFINDNSNVNKPTQKKANIEFKITTDQKA